MGTKNQPGVFERYEKAHPDEPMFVLVAHDPHAAVLVRLWAKLLELRASGERDLQKVQEARQCAERMEDWRRISRTIPASSTRPTG